MPAACDVVHTCQDAGTTEYNDRPIEVASPVRIALDRCDGEEGENKADQEECQRDVVDRSSPSSKRPSARQQWLAAQALQPDASDGDYV